MDDDGQVFCYFRQADLAALVGCSERTLRRALIALRDRGLIYTRKVTYAGACRYYVGRDARIWLRPAQAREL